MKKISIHNMPQKERIATEQECKVRLCLHAYLSNCVRAYVRACVLDFICSRALLPRADCRILILALSAANTLSRILCRSVALLHTPLLPCACISVSPPPQVLQRLRHPGIVCYEDSFIHKNRQVCEAPHEL